MSDQKHPTKMTEAELAQYYEDRKGDVSHLSKTPRPMRRKRGEGPSTSFAVRVTPEEIEQLQEAAITSGTTLSDFIRTAALGAATAFRSTGVTRGTSPTMTGDMGGSGFTPPLESEYIALALHQLLYKTGKTEEMLAALSAQIAARGSPLRSRPRDTSRSSPRAG